MNIQDTSSISILLCRNGCKLGTVSRWLAHSPFLLKSLRDWLYSHASGTESQGCGQFFRIYSRMPSHAALHLKFWHTTHAGKTKITQISSCKDLNIACQKTAGSLKVWKSSSSCCQWSWCKMLGLVNALDIRPCWDEPPLIDHRCSSQSYSHLYTWIQKHELPIVPVFEHLELSQVLQFLLVPTESHCCLTSAMGFFYIKGWIPKAS